LLFDAITLELVGLEYDTAVVPYKPGITAKRSLVLVKRFPLKELKLVGTSPLKRYKTGTPATPVLGILELEPNTSFLYVPVCIKELVPAIGPSLSPPAETAINALEANGVNCIVAICYFPLYFGIK